MTSVLKYDGFLRIDSGGERVLERYEVSMLVPFIAPLKITCLVIATVFLLSFLFAVFLGVARLKSLLGAIVLGALLFFPTWAIVHTAVDKTRYGGFAYPNLAAVSNARVAKWLPPSAEDITVYCKYHMHHARFRANKDDLISWVNDYRAKNSRDEADAVPYADADLTTRRMDDEAFEVFFGGFGWSSPKDYIEMGFQSAPSDAGFTVWYSESQGTAYLRGAYW